ncbi:uncharacterized protein N0V89_010901 [Didymosphaeria variabile]|uniref:Uncharacterized protein n=1 Tax=Didymosphaeria variabile TaxID=1932322 RepID=A0A9W8XCI2_9PLEO|nr:uncharacterized protein N0V89_010901 [Didymosphaeria variabile]KAJ4346968.1 hypothetical protein N0V89_010901 [Didymosphaeria variabile]
MSIDHHAHTAFANRPSEHYIDAAAIDRPETWSGNMRRLIETSSRFLIGGVFALYFLAVMRDPQLFNTLQEWLVGAFSIGCICGLIYGVYKYFEWLETRDDLKPVVEDVGHLRAAMNAVSEEGEHAQKRRTLASPQFGLADPATGQRGLSSSVGGRYYD